MLQELVEEVPNTNLLPGHRPLVEVGEEALGLVKDDHVASEVETGAAQDVVAPLEYVHQAVELDDEARGVPDGRVLVGVQVVLEPKLPKVAHDVPRQGLAVHNEQVVSPEP